MATAPRLGFLPQSPLARAIALASLLIAAVVIGYAGWRGMAPAEKALIGGAFALTDQFGQRRADADFRGQFLLVFFGFTHCPDICPVALLTMSDALDRLGVQAAAVTPIFITVDPERDTAEALRDYAANFHPRLVALTGTPAEIGAVAKLYRVFYAKATGTSASADPADYIMDHSAIIYLMGPDGSYVTHFEPGTAAQAMADELRERL
jgi:protein SCO1/2